MTYATQQDIVDRYGEDALLIVADRNNDNVVDAVVVTGALEDATDEINTYIGRKYGLPLPHTPRVLNRLCVDIALYRMSPDSSYTEEKRKRYEDAVRVLKGFASGEASLGLPQVQEPQASAGSVEVVAPGRQFSRKNMGRLT